ncbi:MAG: hypothetical protein H6Q67_632 [Firmicutes bacterium]|nr:hypothetical protein [Bacillota bacterium]
MFRTIANIRISPVGLEQALNDIVRSITEEEVAISKILNFEGEIIQKAKKGARNIKSFISVNESVNSVIENVIKLQKVTQDKLEFVEELLQGIGDFNKCDDQEE